jgi:hypothetical protein
LQSGLIPKLIRTDVVCAFVNEPRKPHKLRTLCRTCGERYPQFYVSTDGECYECELFRRHGHESREPGQKYDRREPAIRVAPQRRRTPGFARYVFCKRPRCPGCGSVDLLAVRTIHKDGGTVTRRTLCRTCGQKFMLVLE